jgi:hypothetical protein
MSYDMWKTTEPSDIDDAPDPQREDDAIRERRWTRFGDVLREFLTSEWLTEIAHAYRKRHDPDAFGPGRLAWHIQQFAETEGWDGVLNAIARALREDSEAERQQRSGSAT